MKKTLSTLLAMTVMAGIYGCGDNKTKEKLLGTSVVTSTTVGSTGSFLSNPDAASMTALYKISFLGAGAGSFSFSGAPRRMGAPSAAMRAPSAEEGLGLGTPNASGEYNIADPMGMTVTLKFIKSLNGTDSVVYMDFSKAFSGTSGLFVYDTQDFSSTKYILGSDQTAIQELVASLKGGDSHYIPSIWIRAIDGSPMAWYELTLAKMDPNAGGLDDLESFMLNNFPEKMVSTVSGSIPGGTMSMTLTSDMPSSRPTNANPATMTGNGTVTFATGEVWTITASMSAGESGPVGGTMTFSSNSGESGTMTYNSDGSMDGVQKRGATTIGTIHIDASGTGTYTDVESGKTFSITGARPQA